MRTTPDRCERGLDAECSPLHKVICDTGDTFICCGCVESNQEDRFRFCFKSEKTDTMYDHNEYDFLDSIEVMVRGMSTFKRLADE